MPVPIYDRVRSHVDAAGLTYERVAAATGWSLRKTQRLLHGKTALHADHVEKLARLVKKPVGALYVKAKG